MRPVLVNRTLYEKIFIPRRAGSGGTAEAGRQDPRRPYDKFFSGPPQEGRSRSALPARRGPRAFRPSGRPPVSSGGPPAAPPGGFRQGALGHPAAYFFSGSGVAFFFDSSNWRCSSSS